MGFTLLGILIWLVGWWFTGRLFQVYRKANFLEAAQRRREGHTTPPTGHHAGTALFVLLDLGLLLVGIVALGRLAVLWGWSRPGSMGAQLVQWSLLVCLFLLREGTFLHHFYFDQWRARARRSRNAVHRLDSVRRLWSETPPALRTLFFLAPLLATVPFLARLLGCETAQWVRLPGGSVGAFIAWFLLPQALLLVALAAPISRRRRRARLGDGA